jgi:hypothetical protein
MELGFNIAWLVVALALSLGWVRSTNEKRFHHSLFALMLLVMLLFPVISITDDVHQDYFNLSGEEVHYKDDLQQRLDAARQHYDAAALPAILPPALAGISLINLTFERVVWVHPLPAAEIAFPPTVGDLPPPQLV